MNMAPMHTIFSIEGTPHLSEIITPVAFSNPAGAQALPAGRQGHRAKAVNALWDTGSNSSFLTPKLVADLCLEPIGEAWSQTSIGRQDFYLYEINVHLNKAVMVQRVRVGVWFEDRDEWDAVLGMDILQLGTFTLTQRGGRTAASFTVPDPNAAPAPKPHSIAFRK